MENADKPVLTDAALRNEIAQGKKPPQIAREYGISKQAVYQRVNRLDLTDSTLTVMAKPESRRYVNSQIDILEQLGASLARVNLLMDACDRWLRDANNADQYDIGARTNEISVSFFNKETQRNEKAPLSELLDLVQKQLPLNRSEVKFADPRNLILSTAQETRQTVMAAADLAEKLVNAQKMQQFRDALLGEVRKESPDCAERIAKRLRPVLILHSVTE